MTAAPRTKRLPAKLRREALLEAAVAEFLAEGFEGATLEAIVKRCGGSREVIYQEFGDKAGLFAAASIRALSGQPADFLDALGPDKDGLPMAAVLKDFGVKLMHTVLSPRAMALHRIAVGESLRFPEIGRLMYARLPNMGAGYLADYLARKRERGDIKTADTERAAWWFIMLVQGNLHVRAEYHPGWRPQDGEVEAWVSGAVDLFLKGLEGG